jgi:hypothetical protein
MCLVSKQARQLMFNAPIDLWDNDITRLGEPWESGPHPQYTGPPWARRRVGYYTTDQLIVLATRWHITNVHVRELNPCEPRFVEWPVNVTKIYYHDRVEEEVYRTNSTRSYVIPSHLRSFGLEYGYMRPTKWQYLDNIVISPSNSLTSQLRDFELFHSDSRVKQLAALGTCLNLERVSLDYEDTKASWAWVWGLPNLKHLVLAGAAADEWLHAYIPDSTWPIERLGLEFCDDLLDLTRILLMPQLTWVDLSQADGLLDVQALGELRHLQTLTMSECEQLSLLPIMTKLSTLRVESCETLSEDCSYLNTCPNLRSIEIESMRSLKSFDVELTLLESLTLVNCCSLKSVLMPRSVQRLRITGCPALVSVKWSTSRVEADSHPWNIVRHMNGDYTLAC